jgi:AAA15 family ATPase/GTPase
MIESIHITNFRGFKNISVSDMKKVNLLVGPNSSGKSAFLEAVFLSSGSTGPVTTIQLRATRRMGNVLINPVDGPTYRGIWEDLFFDFKQDRKITIRIEGNPNSDTRSLSIEYVTDQAQELPFGKQSSTASLNQEQSNVMPQIEFKWKRRNFPEVVSRPKFTQTGMQMSEKSQDVMYFPCIWYSPGAPETPDENAKRFSELDKRGDGKVNLIKSVITNEFPFIKDVLIEYQAAIPMMFAELHSKPRKMPFGLISDGINRLLGICISLGYFSGGTMLIDQLEDGFHYKLLPSIWKSIYNLASEFQVQLFISSHSKECIDAMLPTVRGNESDFCLLRASRGDEGCEIHSHAGTYLETALEQEFEVR